MKKPAAHSDLLIDIGIISAGSLSAEEFTDIRGAGRSLVEQLAVDFPEFHWRLSTEHRRDIGEFSREESSHLLLQGADERSAHNWDFVLLITADDLIPRYSGFAMAALSRPLDAAVISLCRLAPTGDTLDPSAQLLQQYRDSRVRRLRVLMLQATGHWAGLRSVPVAERVMHHPAEAAQLDKMVTFSEAEQEKLKRFFSEVADTRLEEQKKQQTSKLLFWLRATWINRFEIAEAILAARPWAFPIHLSRLTTAAVSTTAVLLLTAEAWDLALSQSAFSLIVMMLVVLAATTVFIANRHQLISQRRRIHTEQHVVTQVSTVCVVVLGMCVTWVALCSLAWAVSYTLYSHDLIKSWAVTSQGSSGAALYAKSAMASFCASIGLLIGSLGASFEEQHYFRHIIFVDEEI